MSTETSKATIIMLPIVQATISGVNAISIAAHSVRVELNTPKVHTVRFPRSKFNGDASKIDDAMNLADQCRVVAYRYGTRCKRNLTR